MKTLCMVEIGCVIMLSHVASLHSQHECMPEVNVLGALCSLQSGGTWRVVGVRGGQAYSAPIEASRSVADLGYPAGV